MSRTASRYSPSFALSLAPMRPCSVAIRSRTESRMLRSVAICVGARRPIGAAAAAEHPLEQDARIVLHRQRRRRSPPGDGVGVGAAEPDVARAGQVAAVDGHLQRGELRLVAERLRDQLIDRDAGLDLGGVGALRRDVGEEARRGAGMHAGAGGGRRRRVVGEPREHGDAIAERLERLHRRREREAGTLLRGRPLLHHHAVRHVDHAEAERRLCRRLRRRGERRHHAVQQRQRQRGAEAAQNRAARQRHPGDDHDSVLRIWNGALETMPMTTDDQRKPSRDASRTIRRSVGRSWYSTPRPSA